MDGICNGGNSRSHAAQTMTLYDCGNKCYVEMQGWVYTIHRDVAQKLLVTRDELLDKIADGIDKNY